MAKQKAPDYSKMNADELKRAIQGLENDEYRLKNDKEVAEQYLRQLTFDPTKLEKKAFKLYADDDSATIRFMYATSIKKSYNDYDVTGVLLTQTLDDRGRVTDVDVNTTAPGGEETFSIDEEEITKAIEITNDEFLMHLDTVQSIVKSKLFSS
jgi:hypothetical protein